MSIKCLNNAAGIYGRYGEYTKYEIDTNNIDDVYKLLYNNIQVRNEIICCNENGGCEYYTSGDIHTSLYIGCNFSNDYDVINKVIFNIFGQNDKYMEVKKVNTKNVILADISFELFKNIIYYFEDIVLGEYGDNILELTQENNKFILNMRSECYTDTETESDTDSDTDIEPL
jgi:hypothetical protein